MRSLSHLIPLLDLIQTFGELPGLLYLLLSRVISGERALLLLRLRDIFANTGAKCVSIMPFMILISI